MSPPTPHYLLFSNTKRVDDSSRRDRAASEDGRGRWEFVLESMDGRKRIQVADREEQVAGQRLELLAVVRGLEALDQPSRVTLLTSSTYVLRGMRFGLPQWREDGWQWESFGRMTPVRNADLWRRLDRALQIHRVRCRTWRVDAAHPQGPATARPVMSAVPEPAAVPRAARSWRAAWSNFWGRIIAAPVFRWQSPFAANRLCAD